MRIRDVSWKLKAERQLDLRTRLFTKPGLDNREAKKPPPSDWPTSPLLLQFPLLSYISFSYISRRHGHWLLSFHVQKFQWEIDPLSALISNTCGEALLSPVLIRCWPGSNQPQRGGPGLFCGNLAVPIWNMNMRGKDEGAPPVLGQAEFVRHPMLIFHSSPNQFPMCWSVHSGRYWAAGEGSCVTSLHSPGAHSSQILFGKDTLIMLIITLIMLMLNMTLIMLMISCFSHVQLFATPWTIARQAPLSMGFSRQEYWSGLPCPSLGDLPDPWIKPASLKSPALVGGFFVCFLFIYFFYH